MSEPKAISRLRTKITKENLWIYILRLLQERPHYGYEIKKEIKERFNFQPAMVSGYAIIYRLVKDGLVEAKEDPNSTRKYYEITPTGQKAMREAKKILLNTLNSVFDLTE